MSYSIKDTKTDLYLTHNGTLGPMNEALVFDDKEDAEAELCWTLQHNSHVKDAGLKLVSNDGDASLPDRPTTMKDLTRQTLSSPRFAEALQQLICEHMLTEALQQLICEHTLLHEKSCDDRLTDQINAASNELCGRMISAQLASQPGVPSPLAR